MVTVYLIIVGLPLSIALVTGVNTLAYKGKIRIYCNSCSLNNSHFNWFACNYKLFLDIISYPLFI